MTSESVIEIVKTAHKNRMAGNGEMLDIITDTIMNSELRPGWDITADQWDRFVHIVEHLLNFGLQLQDPSAVARADESSLTPQEPVQPETVVRYRSLTSAAACNSRTTSGP